MIDPPDGNVLMTMRLLPYKIHSLMLISISALYTTPSLAASRVAAVTVYPGSAAVDRVASIDASTRKVVFDCLPAGLDTQSLQIDSDVDVRVGEMSIKTLAREQSSCAAHPLDGQIRALEDQKAALQAESDALDLVKGYLKGVSSTSEDNSTPTTPRVSRDGKTIAATIDTLHHSGQSAYLRQYQLGQQIADLDRSLQPLIAERGRSQPKGQVKTVSASIYAPRGATVHLRYQVRGPSWSPAYRALLDTQSNKLKIERQAMVSQATGEDWSGVRLLLSTGQPNANAAGPTPWPWSIGIQPPPQAERYSAKAYGAMAPAPAPVPVFASLLANEPAPVEDVAPNYAVSVVDYGYTTEFAIPGSIDVPSSGEKVAFSLGQTDLAAKLSVRTSPAQDANAYLLADVTQPEGVWPRGPIQLYRDGAFVGSSTLSFGSDDVEDVESKGGSASSKKLTLSFGRDELVRVIAEPVQDSQSIAGLTGARRERHVVHSYVVENKHSQPIHAQILEAAPVATDDSIHITRLLQPAPVTEAWRKQQGTILWRLDIPAGQRTRVTADYTISSPKDALLTGQ